MAPVRNRPEDVGGVPDRNHDFRDLESMEAAEGWQRVAKTETAMKPIRNRPEDVGGAVDPNFARRDLDSMDPYVFPLSFANHASSHRVTVHAHPPTIIRTGL